MKTTIKNGVRYGRCWQEATSAEPLTDFAEIEVAETEHYLNQTVQNGIFGELEEGTISAEEFIKQLSELVVGT